MDEQLRQTSTINRSSIESIITLLRGLTKEERKHLIQELQPNDYFRQHLSVFSLMASEEIELTTSQIRYRIFRASDEAYISFSNYNLPISADSRWGRLFLSNLAKSDPILELGKAYWLLNHLFGESSYWFDTHKASFSFPLFTEIWKGQRRYNYMTIIQDFRGELEFSIRRCVDEWIPDSMFLHHEPYADEFSLEEIRDFVSCFSAYLLKKWQMINLEDITPFYRIIPASCILYGYCKQDGFFEFQYKSEKRRNNFLAERNFSLHGRGNKLDTI